MRVSTCLPRLRELLTIEPHSVLASHQRLYALELRKLISTTSAEHKSVRGIRGSSSP
ncbi:hypothetical protein D3C80_2033350 [compost metagenome]